VYTDLRRVTLPLGIDDRSTIWLCLVDRVYIPPEETAIIREGAAASSAGISMRISRNGATTCPTIVSSVPAVSVRIPGRMAPALWMSTSSRSWVAQNWRAKTRTASRSSRSARP
jgi:hypothetical protein